METYDNGCLHVLCIGAGSLGRNRSEDCDVLTSKGGSVEGFTRL
jgi:hypothetical protein